MYKVNSYSFLSIGNVFYLMGTPINSISISPSPSEEGWTIKLFCEVLEKNF
jgi:hypothetical protein